MTPPTGTALLILVAFVLPGFVTLLISERTHVVKDTSTAFERLLLALYYSVLTYAIVALGAWLLGYDRAKLTSGYHHEQNVGEILLGASFLILVIPAFIATVSRVWLKSGLRGWLIQKSGINPGHATPTGWDHFFQQGREAFIRATLADGRVVGGYYGGGSFATYGEQGRDIFISQQWELDFNSWFKKPAEASIGLWLPKESIVSFEVYAVPRDAERAEADTTSREAHREEGRVSAPAERSGTLDTPGS
jgi:hypothetical protein